MSASTQVPPLDLPKMASVMSEGAPYTTRAVAGKIESGVYCWALFDSDGDDGKIADLASSLLEELIAKRFSKPPDKPIEAIKALFSDIESELRAPCTGTICLYHRPVLLVATIGGSRVYLARREDVKIRLADLTISDKFYGEIPPLSPRSKGAGAKEPHVVCFKGVEQGDQVVLLSPRTAASLPPTEVAQVLHDCWSSKEHIAHTLSRAMLMHSPKKDPIGVIHQSF